MTVNRAGARRATVDVETANIADRAARCAGRGGDDDEDEDAR